MASIPASAPPGRTAPPRAVPKTDCVVVGASFAGLACATALARAGLRVKVLEKKADPGEKLHTTGILVKDAIDQVALLDELPAEHVRRVDGVRLYAPDLRPLDLHAPGYYFLTTDTAGLLRWLAGRAEAAGAHIACGEPFRHARRSAGGLDLGAAGRTRYLVGADGALSQVARAFGLGRNARFLFGVEHEYANVDIPDADKLHCFLDRRLAPGYIAWVIAGVGRVQVGLARRWRRGAACARAAMPKLVEKIAPVFDFRGMRPDAVRAGMIPCGGIVSPVAAPRVLLVGDAAGMVSPLTAGGIHTALEHGLAAGHAVADFLDGRRPDPSRWLARSYPRFPAKRVLRFLFDHFQSDVLANRLLFTGAARAAAAAVYFHSRRAPAPAGRREGSERVVAGRG